VGYKQKTRCGGKDIPDFLPSSAGVSLVYVVPSAHSPPFLSSPPWARTPQPPPLRCDGISSARESPDRCVASDGGG